MPCQPHGRCQLCLPRLCAQVKGALPASVSVIWSQPHSLATASLPASDKLYTFPKRVPFCDSNCLYKSVQELSLAVSSVCPTAPPQVRESLCALSLPLSSARCSLLAPLCATARQAPGEPPSGTCPVSALPGFQRCLPLPGPHGNLTPTGAKLLSFTAAERKDDTGAGAASQPQSPSSPLAKAQKHFLISGARLLPEAPTAGGWPPPAWPCLLCAHSPQSTRGQSSRLQLRLGPGSRQRTLPAPREQPRKRKPRAATLSGGQPGDLCERLGEVRQACRQSGGKRGRPALLSTVRALKLSPSFICPSSSSQQNHKLQLS